jgi:hypothetical protein
MKQERTNISRFSLPIPRKEISNPSSQCKLPSKRKRTSLQEELITPLHPFTKRKHQKTFARERDTKNSQEGANLSQVLLTMGELCYEMRFT